MTRLTLCTTFCAFVLSATAVFGQQAAETPAAPVPPELVSARKIFVANGGADGGLFPSPFSGLPSRGYDELYAALRASGRYQLESSPADADLVLELRLTAPYGPSNANKVKGASDPLPMFRLAIYDEKTHYVLWALTSTIEIAYLQKTHDRNFDEAVSSIVAQFEALSGTPAAAHP